MRQGFDAGQQHEQGRSYPQERLTSEPLRFSRAMCKLQSRSTIRLAVTVKAVVSILTSIHSCHVRWNTVFSQKLTGLYRLTLYASDCIDKVYGNSLQGQHCEGRLDFSPRSSYYAAFSAIPALDVMASCHRSRTYGPFQATAKIRFS